MKMRDDVGRCDAGVETPGKRGDLLKTGKGGGRARVAGGGREVIRCLKVLAGGLAGPIPSRGATSPLICCHTAPLLAAAEEESLKE